MVFNREVRRYLEHCAAVGAREFTDENRLRACVRRFGCGIQIQAQIGRIPELLRTHLPFLCRPTTSEGSGLACPEDVETRNNVAPQLLARNGTIAGIEATVRDGPEQGHSTVARDIAVPGRDVTGRSCGGDGRQV